MTEIPVDVAEELETEDEKVGRWRLEYVLTMRDEHGEGYFTVPHAELIADDRRLDLHRLEDLLELGCPPMTAWRIVASDACPPPVQAVASARHGLADFNGSPTAGEVRRRVS